MRLPFDSSTGSAFLSASMRVVYTARMSGRSGNQVIQRNPSASHCVQKIPLARYRPSSVVLRAGADTDDLHEALKEHVKRKIGLWKYPRWIDVVESLPKTATGKIQRFKLREGAQ